MRDVTKHEEMGSGPHDVLTQVRDLDPNCNVANVAQFFREIDSALRVLRAMDVTGQPLPIAFDPRWQPDQQP